VTTVALKSMGMKAWLRESLARSDFPPVGKEPAEVEVNAEAAAAPIVPILAPMDPPFEAASAQAAVTGHSGPADKKKRNGRRKTAVVPSASNEPDRPPASRASKPPPSVNEFGVAVARRPRPRKVKNTQSAALPALTGRGDDPVGTDV
jgi:hypothetical protein